MPNGISFFAHDPFSDIDFLPVAKCSWNLGLIWMSLDIITS